MTDYPFLLLVLVADILLWIGLARYIAVSKKDALHIGVIFCGLFILTYPLKLIASLFGLSVMNPLELHEEWLWLSFAIFNLSGLMFLLPILVMKPFYFSGTQSGFAVRHVKKKHTWMMTTVAVVIIGLSYGPHAVSAVFSFSSELLQSRIADRGDERLGSGPLALFRSLGEVLLAMALIRLSAKWFWGKLSDKVMVVALLAVVCFFLLAVSGSKHHGLAPLFYFIVFLNMTIITSGARGWGFAFILKAGLIGTLLTGIFGVIRGFGSIVNDSGYGMWFQVFQQLSNAFDGPDNLAFILSRMNSLWLGDLYFEPTFQYIAGVIPRILWEDKPVIMGNLFIQEIYLFERFTSETGEVISPSMPGEMLVSGGILFMCIWSLLLGLFFSFHYKLAYCSTNWIWKVLYVFLAANVFNVLRSGTGIVGAYIPFAVALIVVWIALLFIRSFLRIARTAPRRTNLRDCLG